MPSKSNQEVVEELLALLSERGILVDKDGEARLKEEGFVSISGHECTVPNVRSKRRSQINVNTNWFHPPYELSKPTRQSWLTKDKLEIDFYLFPIPPKLFALHYLELHEYALQLEEEREKWFHERRWGLIIDENKAECHWIKNTKCFPIREIRALSDLKLTTIQMPPKAIDIDEPQPTSRVIYQQTRIVRDTQLTLSVKRIYDFQCQICGTVLQFSNGQRYAEAHHLKPLGGYHNGPDVLGNIICVCPNHHALLDHGGMQVDPDAFVIPFKHNLAEEYVQYHNSEVFRGV